MRGHSVYSIRCRALFIPIKVGQCHMKQKMFDLTGIKLHIAIVGPKVHAH